MRRYIAAFLSLLALPRLFWLADWFLRIAGLAGLPEDIRTWAGWLTAMSDSTANFLLAIGLFGAGYLLWDVLRRPPLTASTLWGYLQRKGSKLGADLLIGICLLGLIVGVVWKVVDNGKPSPAEISSTTEPQSEPSIPSPSQPPEPSKEMPQAPDQEKQGVAGGSETSPPSPPPQADNGAPPSSTNTNTYTSLRSSHLLYDAISLEEVDDPEKSEVPFTSSYFRTRLAQELDASYTTISRIRMAVAFIEPRESRGQAPGGTIIGYILISLPSLPNCSRKFGSQTYSFSDATTGMMKAINDYVYEIANWIQRASLGETLTCPTD